MKSFALVAVILISLQGAAMAGELHGDVELDPTAYGLDGDSVHVGVGVDRFRLDVGSFAERLPQVFHGHDGFDVSFSGWGVKIQAFLTAEPHGWFAGIDGGVLRVLAQRHGTDLAQVERQVSLGIHLGYRFELPAHFYVTPWIGVGYGFGARDITLDGATYHADPVSVFPAVHLGYRFR